MLRQVLMMRPQTWDDDVDPGAQCDTAAVYTSALSALHWSLHSPESTVRTVFSSVSAHWYSQLLGNLMGFYLNWNCLIYKLIYFLILKITLTRHQTINQEWESAHISTACEQQQKKMSRLKNIPGNSRDISITKIPPVQT